MRRRVLLLEDDPTARRHLGSMLSNAGYDVVVATSLPDAWSLLSPDVRFLIVSGKSGFGLLEHVRTAGGVYRHVVVLTSGGRRQEIVDALEAGADDVIAKPVSAALLVSHLTAAERGRSQRTNLVEAIREASRQGCGELVVRADQLVARVFFHDGDIAWMAVPGRPTALEAALGSPIRDRRDEARAIFDECRRTGQSFDEVIDALGLVPAEIVARRLRRWFIDGFEVLRALQNPEVLFLPGRLAFSGGHRVSVSVLLADEPSSLLPPLARVTEHKDLPPERHAPCDALGSCRGCGDDVTTTIRRLLDLEAVLGAAVVHAATGQPIGAGGVTIDPDVLTAQLRTLGSLPRDEHPAELLLTGATTIHLAHATACESAMVCVLAVRKMAPLALLRVSVSRVVKELQPSLEAPLEAAVGTE